jgi:hypothetical protein
MARTVIGPEAIEENTLEDADGDTKVQVEESSDEDKIRFDTAGTERMIVDNTGNVGIGTSSPISKLDIAGKISITSESSTPAQPANGKGFLYTKTDGKLYWRSYDISETDLTNSGGSVAADDISTGDAAINLQTSSGNVLVDSQAGSATVDGHTGVTVQSTNSGNVTLDSVADVVLSAAGGNVTMDDGTTTVFDFDTDNVVFKMMDDADTGDYMSFTIGANGSTVAATNDDDGFTANLTFDVDGTIYLDAYAYGTTILREGAQEYLRFQRASSGTDHAEIQNMENAMDLVFKQYDGTETFRLTDAGNATVAADLTVTGDIILDDGGSIKEAGGTAAIIIDGSGHVTKIGQDSPSSDEVLTWDGSKAVWSAAGGGGSSSEYFHLHLSGRVRNTNGNLFGHAAYAYNAGDADWTTSLSSYVSSWTTGDTSFDATYANAMLYFTIGVAPAAMDLTSARIAYYMANDNMSDDYIWEIWKATPTSGTGYTTSLSWSRVGQLDRGGDPVAETFYATSGTFTSSNSLAAGDLIGLTVHNPGDTYTSKYHAYHLALRFTYT